MEPIRGCGLYIFAQFIEPDAVCIDTTTIAVAERLVKESFPVLSCMSCEYLLLAHELFHVLEFQRTIQKIDDMHVPIFKFGPFVYKRALCAPSEIGAMAFAKELTGVGYNPQILDVILMGASDPAQAEQLGNRILQVTDGKMK